MNADRFVLAARMASYLGSADVAVEVLTDGLTAHPADIRLLHQRGTLKLISRDITGAAADLRAAVEADDGTEFSEAYREQVVSDLVDVVLHRAADAAPASGGSVRVSARLHLALALYLLDDAASAAEIFAQARSLASEPHQALAALDWEYLSRHRAGQPERAQQLIDELDWDEYHLDQAPATTARSLERCYVQRLRLYRGEARPEELLRATSVEGIHVATLGYGVGAWYLYRGFPDAAARTFARILEVGDPTTMGYLAAETEHARSAPTPG